MLLLTAFICSFSVSAAANYAITTTATLQTTWVNGLTSTSIVRVGARTAAQIEFIQYAPAAASSTPTQVNTTYCSDGSVAPAPTPITAGGAALTVPASLPLLPADSYKVGNTLFLRVLDADANQDPMVLDTVEVVLTIPRSDNPSLLLDTERLTLTETAVDSGIFVGYVQSTIAATGENDCRLTVENHSEITASYTDSFDGTDTAASAVLVDPFGLIFDSQSGAPVSNVTVTLLDAMTGMPATVFGDDGVSLYDNPVISGTSATDSSGAVYTFPPGYYRFPFVQPGDYILQLDGLPPGFSAPSAQRDLALINALPGGPFAIHPTASYGERFNIPVGPVMHIDIPVDSASGALFITKQASRSEVAIGDFLQYTLTLTNPNPIANNPVRVEDRLPPGMRYQQGSLRIGGATAVDPQIGENGHLMTISPVNVAANGSVTISYVVEVGVGTPKGEVTNTAWVVDAANISSNFAEATVKVRDDLLHSISHVAGRVMVGNCPLQSPPEGEVSLRLSSTSQERRVEYRAKVGVTQVAVRDLMLTVALPEVLDYEPGSARLGGQALPDPQQVNGQLLFDLGMRDADWSEQLTFATQARSDQFGEFATRAHLKFSSATARGVRTPIAENTLKDFHYRLRPHFASMEAELNETDIAELQALLAKVAGEKVLHLHVIGHTDNRKIRPRARQRYRDNYALSLARAAAVGEYLRQALQLDEKALTVEGRGPDEPIANNATSEGRELNRRVEVYFDTERQRSGMRFLLPVADSGEQKTTIVGETAGRAQASVGTDLDGVEGIRMVMEDGRYAITDKLGLYHFEGLRPGVHRVQIDPESLPSHLELIACEQNTRFAGNADSRFVEMQGGTLWRSDFYLAKRQPIKGEVSLRLTSHPREGRVAFHAEVEGHRLTTQQRELVVRLPPALQYVANTTVIDGKPASEPRRDAELLRFSLPANDAGEWRHQLLFETQSDLKRLGEQQVIARVEYTTSNGEEGTGRWAENRIEHLPVITREYVFNANFDLLGSSLSPRDRRSLDEVVSTLRQTDVRHLRVIGHTDNLAIHGSSLSRYEDNYALSRARAAAVADYLRSRLLLHHGQIEVVGMGPDQPVADNATAKGRQANRRVELQVEIVDLNQDARIEPRDHDSGVVSDRVIYGAPSEKVSAAPADAATDETREGMLSLVEGERVVQRIRSLRVRLDSRLKLELLLDGEAVSNERIGFRMVDEKNRRTLYSFIGVDLGGPGEHTLEVRGIDPFGNARYQQKVNYTRTGEITDIRLVESGGNVADGNTPVRIKLQLIDESGEAVQAASELRLISGNLTPYLSDQERNQFDPRLGRDTQLVRVDSDGVASFAAVAKSGLYQVELGYNNIRRKVKVYVKPQYRKTWLMVGVAEGTAGYNTLSGNLESLAVDGGEEGGYTDGRMAFYAKGRIKGEWLLTIAYDSAKETGREPNPLFQTIAPDAYYTLYGDNSQQQFDAQSAEKLYLRLEADQFYALFGDYQTGLSVTELSTYNRTMTGLKTEYVGEHVSVTAFASDTNQAFIKDEIPGNGTSGLYRLSRSDLRRGSDSVHIEVRDRFRSERVISSRMLVRYSDYNIDYRDGTLFFKEPIFSRDENFNPVYIVARYEVINQEETAIVAGGRTAVSFADNRVELGASVISDTTAGAPADLYGVDARYDISPETSARAEYAASEQGVGVGATSGTAYLAEVTHNDGKLNASAYIREQSAGFGMAQQPGSEDSTRKMGVDGKVKLSDQISVFAEGRREEILSTNAVRDMLNTGVTYSEELYTLGGGMRLVRDETGNGSVNESSLLTATANRLSEDRRLRTYANGEFAVGDDASSDYPSRLIYGVEYLLVESTSVFAAQELASGEAQDSVMTRIGLKSAPWENATFTSVLQENSSEYGPRRFATMGLNQKWPLSDTLVVDFGVDHSKTLTDPGAVPLNPNAPLSSGNVSGDFTSMTTGVTSTHALWSANLRGESLWGENEDKRGLLVGVYRQQTPGLGLASILEYWDRETTVGAQSTEASVEFSLAYRPIASRLILLDKLKYSYDDERGGLDDMTQYKLVNNLNANYLFDRANQLAVHYGVKQIRDNIESLVYRNLLMALGTEYRHDISPKWDWGLRFSVLYDTNLSAYTHSEGLSLGYNWARNIWASVGYNRRGYSEADFTSAGYTAEGPYLKLRIGLDQRTSRDVLAWWEGKGADNHPVSLAE